MLLAGLNYNNSMALLLTFLLAQAERYRPRLAYFDKDRGAEGFIRAAGGVYDVLSPGRPTGFNPLALPDTAENRSFLADWLAQLATANGGAPLDDEDRLAIADAIDANYAQPPGHRQLRYLRELFRGRRRPTVGDLSARLAAGPAAMIGPKRSPLGLSADPGGFPLYRNDVLIGAIGVSGDGIEQDDIVGASGAKNFLAPQSSRADNFVYESARLPYARFPRASSSF